MANTTVYPYGTGGSLPSSIGLVNDLVTGGSDKALAAEQGKVIGDYIFGPFEAVDISGVTISSYSLGDNSTANSKWGANGQHFVIPVNPGERFNLTVESSQTTGGWYAFLTSSYTPPASTSTPVPYVSGTDRVWLNNGSVVVTAPEGAAYLCCCPRDGSSNNSTWSIDKQAAPEMSEDYMSKEDGEQLQEEMDELLGTTEEVYITNYTPINFNLETPSAWASSTRYKCILIPVTDLEGAEKLKFVADTYKYSFAFLKSDNASSGVAPDLCAGTSVQTLTAGTELKQDVPADCNYIYTYVSENNYAYGKIHLYMILSEPDIVKWSELKNLVIDGKGDKNVQVFANSIKSKRFTLFHFTDLHLDEASLSKALAYRDAYGSYINDTLYTGDLVNLYSDSITWWTGADTSDILFAIGNHEIQDRMVAELTNHIGLDAYNKFIGPFISGWGTLGKTTVSSGSLVYDSGNPSGADIFQPASAATDGQCYYFKDYTIGVRMIVLDWMDYDSTQKAWFEAVLADAKTKSLSVVVVSHHPSVAIVKANNQFDSFDSNDVVGESSWFPLITGYTAHEEIQDFIDGGGKFVCWICGHRHRDAFGSLQGYSDQACIILASAKSTVAETDLYMAGDTVCNIFSVDLTQGYFYLQRVGAKETFYGQHRECMAWDYINHKIIR